MDAKNEVQGAVLFGRHPENGRSHGKPNRCKRDGKEKRRAQKTELGGSDPTFRPFGLENDLWGRSRPSAQHTAPRVLARRHRERKEKGTRREEGETKCWGIPNSQSS